MLVKELDKINKDDTRQIFGAFVDNLPQINKKPLRE